MSLTSRLVLPVGCITSKPEGEDDAYDGAWVSGPPWPPADGRKMFHLVNPPHLPNSENQPLSQKEIQARIVASKEAQSFGTGAVDLYFAYLSQRGYYPDCEP